MTNLKTIFEDLKKEVFAIYRVFSDDENTFRKELDKHFDEAISQFNDDVTKLPCECHYCYDEGQGSKYCVKWIALKSLGVEE